MSFKAKTILLLILLSLVPYVVTMTFLGNAYRNDVESRLMEDMEYQLGVTIDRLDQSLQSLQNDIEFIASLDIMNDVDLCVWVADAKPGDRIIYYRGHLSRDRMMHNEG